MYSNTIQTIKVITFWFPHAYFVLGTFSLTLEVISKMHDSYCEKHSSDCSVEDWNEQFPPCYVPVPMEPPPLLLAHSTQPVVDTTLQ